MSAMANILVKDDASTPVEHTLVPITDSPPTWRDSASGVTLEGQVTVTVLANELQKNGTYRRVLRVDVPVMETLGASGTSAGYVAAQKVAFRETFIITQYSSGRSTVENRADALRLALGVVQGAGATTGGGTLANTAAGGAFAASAAMGPRLFIHGDQPF